ncbi:MAG: hypothetical protein GXO78_08615 [Calditrichaeota bacterium]|nr:hypothetical protein [Calditrichota bacterium]
MRTLIKKGLPLVLIFIFSLSAQVHLQGSLQSMVYRWQPPDQESLTDFYQVLQFQLRSNALPGFSTRGYLRFAYRGPAPRWEDRFYHLYLQWQRTDRRLTLRLGRQFLYAGVWNGTFDALQVTWQSAGSLNLRFLLGSRAPFDRQWRWNASTEGMAYGVYLNWAGSSRLRITASILHQQKGRQLLHQLAGVGISGRLSRYLLYHTNLEYNIPGKSVQLFRHLMGYYREPWQVMVEWNHQKPRIREDSYFQIFQIRGFDQLRSSVGYRWHQWLFSLQYLRTWYDSDITNQWILGCSQQWGHVGIILQNGFGGQNLGVYGDVRYPLTSRFTLRAHSSYYNFQRHTVAIGEEATAYSLGLTYRHGPKLQLDADLQQSLNTYFRNDLRALLRLFYRFDI